MFRKTVRTRFGTGVIRKCRGCKELFGFFCGDSGMGSVLMIQDHEINFSMHEVDCLMKKVFHEEKA